MALEFLCSNKIESGIMIKIPEGAEVYRLKSGRVKFFRNSNNVFKKIPKKADYISFYIEGNLFNIEYGEPEFYDSYGKVLK